MSHHHDHDDQMDLPTKQIRLLAHAVVNCHVLARRALHRSTSAYDREKWEQVLRLCENAGARSQGVLRASVPTDLTDGAALLPADPSAAVITETLPICGKCGQRIQHGEATVGRHCESRQYHLRDCRG